MTTATFSNKVLQARTRRVDYVRSRFPTVDSTLLQQCIISDPTPQLRFLEWIVNHARSRPNIHQIRSVLVQYERLKNRVNINLNTLTPEQLTQRIQAEQAVDIVNDVWPNDIFATNERNTEAGIITLYEEGNMWLKAAYTYPAAQELGLGTRWCTTQYDHYTSYEGALIVFKAPNGTKYQFWFHHNELYPGFLSDDYTPDRYHNYDQLGNRAKHMVCHENDSQIEYQQLATLVRTYPILQRLYNTVITHRLAQMHKICDMNHQVLEESDYALSWLTSNLVDLSPANGLTSYIKVVRECLARASERGYRLQSSRLFNNLQVYKYVDMEPIYQIVSDSYSTATNWEIFAEFFRNKLVEPTVEALAYAMKTPTTFSEVGALADAWGMAAVRLAMDQEKCQAAIKVIDSALKTIPDRKKKINRALLYRRWVSCLAQYGDECTLQVDFTQTGVCTLFDLPFADVRESYPEQTMEYRVLSSMPVGPQRVDLTVRYLEWISEWIIMQGDRTGNTRDASWGILHALDTDSFIEVMNRTGVVGSLVAHTLFQTIVMYRLRDVEDDDATAETTQYRRLDAPTLFVLPYDEHYMEDYEFENGELVVITGTRAKPEWVSYNHWQQRAKFTINMIEWMKTVYKDRAHITSLVNVLTFCPKLRAKLLA